MMIGGWLLELLAKGPSWDKISKMIKNRYA